MGIKTLYQCDLCGFSVECPNNEKPGKTDQWHVVSSHPLSDDSVERRQLVCPDCVVKLDDIAIALRARRNLSPPHHTLPKHRTAPKRARKR